MTLWHAAAQPDRPKQVVLTIPLPPVSKEADKEHFRRWARSAQDAVLKQRPWRVGGPVAVKVQLGLVHAKQERGERLELALGTLVKMGVVDNRRAVVQCIDHWTTNVQGARLTVTSLGAV